MMFQIFPISKCRTILINVYQLRANNSAHPDSRQGFIDQLIASMHDASFTTNFDLHHGFRLRAMISNAPVETSTRGVFFFVSFFPFDSR